MPKIHFVFLLKAGPTGDVGSIGATGIKGPTGATGSEGAAGFQGSTGPIGLINWKAAGQTAGRVGNRKLKIN